MIDDAECLRKYAESRDEAAFSEFVRRHIDLVYAAAFRQTRGDGHLAEDIVQKVFVAAARKAGALGGHPVISAWLYQTTRYAAIDAVRSRRRAQAREAAAGEIAETAPEPSAATDWEKISPELDRMIASLGQGERDAVVLRFFGGKSYAEIGAQLRLGENAARMRVERALEKLRLGLSRRGVASTGAALGILLAENGVMASPAGLGSAVIATALSAPAAVGLSLTWATLQIMTTTKITLAAAAFVTLLSLAAAVHEYQHAQVAEAALAAATHARPFGRRDMPLAGSPSGQPAAPAGAASSPTAQPANRPKNSIVSLMDVLGNPAIQQQNAINARARLDGQYGAFFKNLNLTPDQIDQFKNLLVEKEMVGFDSMSAAHDQGIDPASNPRAFFQAVAAAEKTVDAQISSLLGADGFSQFQQYQESVPARNTSLMLSQALSYTATPLTDSQSASVIQVLTQYGTPALPPNNPFAVLNGDLGVTKLNEQGLAQIQGILSAPQVQALEERMHQQSQILQAREQIHP